MAIEWKPALATGIEDIDAQHRELFRRADRLAAALDRGAPDGEVSELLDFLHAYAVWHFGLEEAWMRDTAYPGLAAHKGEHDRFGEDLQRLASAHDRPGTGGGVATRLSTWLQEWLEAHVAGTDAEMGRHLAGRKR